MTALALVACALFQAFGGYLIKYRRRVDLIAGVKDPAALVDSKPLGDWVGNMSFLGAAIMLAGATLTALVPLAYELLALAVTLIGFAGVTFATINGSQS